MVSLPNMLKATSPATESLRIGRLFNHLSCSNAKAHREPDLSAIRWSGLFEVLISIWVLPRSVTFGPYNYFGGIPLDSEGSIPTFA
jgi:hypothetical protein